MSGPESAPVSKPEEPSTAAKVKELIKTGATDFRVVFFYPLCTGIMTGVGFILGKRLGERYFYGSTAPAKAS